MKHIGALIILTLTLVNAKPQSAPPGDVKDQEGSVTKGSYAIIDPNGNKHIVHYTSDGRNGFSAVVEDEAEPGTTTPPQHNDKKDETSHDQKKEKQAPKIQFVPVPVYQPQVSPRGNFYGTPYYPYRGYYPNTYRTPYGYPARYY